MSTEKKDVHPDLVKHFEEKRRLAWRQEYEKQRQAELAIEQAMQREEEKFNLLLNNAAKFQQACMMRNYINAVKQKAMDQNQLSAASIAWVEWATKKANDYDPIMQPLQDLIV